MGLAEIMAAKKAALAAVKSEPIAQNPETQTQVAQIIAQRDEIKTIEPLQKQEEAPMQVEKPLTFAEKMALKKASVVPTPTVSAAPAPKKEDSVEAKNVVVTPSTSYQTVPEEAQQSTGTVALPAADAALIPALEDTGTEATGEASPEVAQAYADVSAKIEILESLEDTRLEGAMKELKKALMANPNAVSLMHDSDYAKMVVALRRITKEAQVEATKEKKPGAKKKETRMMTAEEVEAVFNEL